MSFAEAPVPDPGPRQVRIRNRAAALNFFDILQIQGKYQVRPQLPFTPGAEVAGTVDAVGADVSNVHPGERVLALTPNGGYAEYSLAPASRVFRIPDRMGMAEAAALPVVYHTSLFALAKRASIRSEECLLVHAGASGVGMSAIQIGKAMGARVIATAGGEEKLAFCREQGADEVFDYRPAAWLEQVKAATGGRGADVIYDPVGGDVFDLSTKCLAPEGRLLVIGFSSGRIPGIQANRILLKNISIVGVHWGQYVNDHPGYLAETHAALARMYAEEKIRPVVSRRFPLNCAHVGLRELTGRRVLGKAVLEM